jgi:hypothetical protein
MAATILSLLLSLAGTPGCTTAPDKVPGIFGQDHSASRGYITITFRNSATEEVEVTLLGQAALDPLPPQRQIPPGGAGSFTIPKGTGMTTLSWKAANRAGNFTVGQEPLTINILPSQASAMTGEENKQNDQRVETMIKELKDFETVVQRPGQGAWKNDALDPLKVWAQKTLESGGTPTPTTEPASQPTADQETLYLAQAAMDLRATIANSFHRLGQYYEAKEMPIQAACCYVRAMNLDCPQAQKSISAMLARQESAFLNNWETHLKTDQVLSHENKRMYFEHDFVPVESGKLLGFTDKEMQYKINIRLGQTHAYGSLPPIVHSVSYGKNMVLDDSPNEVVLDALRVAADNRQTWPLSLWREWMSIGVLRQVRPIDAALEMGNKEPARKSATTEPASQPAP